MTTKKLPRVLIAAPQSGGGKTTVVCALLSALVQQGLAPAAFKCGPDYIDPMFHSEIIGAKGANLDLFFTPEDTVRQLLGVFSENCGIAVLEGVMGYYDGVGGTTPKASAWDVARATRTPAVLVLDARGAALSLCAQLRGFLDFLSPSGICGVLLNRCSSMQYAMLHSLLEETCGVPVLGYLPSDPDFMLESRHLGLITAAEVEDLKAKLARWGQKLAETVEIPRLLELAQSAPELSYNDCKEDPVCDGVRIAVARDKAFCFYYRENLALLEELGAELVPFSPLVDSSLPHDIQALYLGGGYPEIYARQLSENKTMRCEIAQKIASGMPTLAECGGFLYLHRQLADSEGKEWPMVGAVAGGCRNTGKLGRFGYSNLTARQDTLLCKAGESIAAHEFHYYDSDNNGSAFDAVKPVSSRSWQCIHSRGNLFAGFPHLYFYANKGFARSFVTAASHYKAIL